MWCDKVTFWYINDQIRIVTKTIIIFFYFCGLNAQENLLK